MLKKYLILVGVLLVILSLVMYPKVYVIRGSAGGVLYWSAHEALLFMSGASSGAQMSHFRYGLEPFFVGMGDVRQPNDQRCSQVLVIRITDKTVQNYETDLYRYAREPYCGFHFNLFRGQFYAVSWPSLWKWSGNRFERPTPEEYGAYATEMARGISQSKHPWEFDNIDGWSMRQFGQTSPRSELVLDGQPLEIVFHGETWPPNPVSVDLVRPGQALETVWQYDGRPHLVSKVEYEHLFLPIR